MLLSAKQDHHVGVDTTTGRTSPLSLSLWHVGSADPRVPPVSLSIRVFVVCFHRFLTCFGKFIFEALGLQLRSPKFCWVAYEV